MCESQIIAITFHRAIHIAFFSELSSHRILEPNHQYINEQQKKGAFKVEDLLNFKIVNEDFRKDHLTELGPHLVCTDEIALAQIANVIYHNMNPEQYKILYMIAKHFGRFDIEEIFEYFDADESNENSYLAQKPFFELMEDEMTRLFKRFPNADKKDDKPLDETNSYYLDDSDIRHEIYQFCGKYEKTFDEIAHFQNKDDKNGDKKDENDINNDEEMEEIMRRQRERYVTQEDHERNLDPKMTKPVINEFSTKKGKKSKNSQEPETTNTNYAEGFREDKKKSSPEVKKTTTGLEDVKFNIYKNAAGKISYNTTYIRLPVTKSQLLSSIGSEFCRKYG
jgi:hypothetical protein